MQPRLSRNAARSLALTALLAGAANLAAADPAPSTKLADRYAAAAKEKWEPTIREFEQLDRRSDYPAESVLFIGSSSIRLWDSLARDMAPRPVIQRGYGGAKFQDLAVFAERLVHPHQFRAVVVFVANDIVGQPSDLTPAEVATLFGEVADTIRAHNPRAPVLLLAITPTESRWPAWPDIRAANNALRELCNQRDDVHFLPTEHLFLGADGTPKPELFRDDKLHLSPAGYALWTKLVRTELDRHLANTASTSPTDPSPADPTPADPAPPDAR